MEIIYELATLLHVTVVKIPTIDLSLPIICFLCDNHDPNALNILVRELTITCVIKLYFGYYKSQCDV